MMLFLGTLFKKADELEILELSKESVSNASNTFQWNLIDGLKKYLSLEIINVLPVGTYPLHYSKLTLRTKKWGHKNENIEVGSINIHILKQFIRYKRIKKEINNRVCCEKRINNIMIYSAYSPFLKAVYKLDRSVNVTLIVTDLPEHYDLRRVGLIKKIIRRLDNYFIYKYISRIDSFVLLTKNMKDPLKVGNRPFIVIEGIVNKADFQTNIYSGPTQKNKKIILYTGTLHYQYGIMNLLEAMKLIENDNYELWICGSGEAKEEIINISKIDKRVKYLGYVTKKEIYKLQQQATLLINPRTNAGEYTKYSFPSKTMEYMLSGRPVLMYKLDGIPNEYDQYLYYIDGNRASDIADKILKICEKPQYEIDEFGQKAREFVLKNKNSEIQAKKIIDMIQRMN